MARFFALHPLENQFPALHGARVLATLSILQLHVTAVATYVLRLPDNPLFIRSRLAWFGMDLFFVLSGFLLGASLFRKSEPEIPGGARRFIGRRISRILPLYYLALTFLYLSPYTTDHRRSEALWEYLYVSNYMKRSPLAMLTVGWSLCVEEQLYMLMPLLVLGLKKLRSSKARLTLLIALWLSGMAVRITDYLLHKEVWNDMQAWVKLYSRTHDRYDPFVAGLLVAFLFCRYRQRFEQVLSRPWVRVVLTAIVLGCGWLLMRPVPLIKDPMLWSVLCWGTFTSVMYIALVSLLVAGKGPVRAALSAPFFRPLATLGYGVYLVHVPLCEHLVVPRIGALSLRYGLSLSTGWWLSVLALALVSYPVAYLLHILIEKPLLALRSRVFPSASRA